MSTETVDEEDALGDDVDRAALIDAFDADDPRLSPEEKETTLRFARDEDVAHFYTAEAGVGRRLIAHPEAVLDGVVVADGDARPTKPPAEVRPTEHVVGVRGTLPVGALLVKSRLRQTDRHAEIISDRVLEEVDRE